MGYMVIPSIMEFVYTVYIIPINRWITIPKYGQSRLTMRHQYIALFLVGCTTWFSVDEKHVGSYPIVKANHHEISGLKDKE